jgi:hypothetical protein
MVLPKKRAASAVWRLDRDLNYISSTIESRAPRDNSSQRRSTEFEKRGCID